MKARKKDFDLTMKLPDVRPLDCRCGKRIKPGQKPDAIEQLFFTPYQVFCIDNKTRRKILP